MTTTLFPAWKQAEADLVAGGLKPGDTLTKERLLQLFGIRQAATIADHQANTFEFMSQMDSLRKRLLRNHNLMLRVITGVGYIVVAPEDQTKVAMRSRGAEVARTLNKLAEAVQFVDTSKLSMAQRQENADAQAKVGTLASMMRSRFRLTNTESK